jgi:hypothetical protein
MATNYSFPFSRRRPAWIILLLLVLIAAVVVIAPVWTIQPFKPQTSRGVTISYSLKRWSPFITIASLIGAFVITGLLWRRTRGWWRKSVLLIVLVPLLGLTWFARQNHFEWMFNPISKASFAKIKDLTFLTDSDIVMAVEKNGEAAAYPVRILAYHHIVQDVVGGVPLVATY